MVKSGADCEGGRLGVEPDAGRALASSGAEAAEGALSDQARAERVARTMLGRDAASRWLGVTLEAVAPGYARMRMHVTSDMLNGHNSCHGGLLFSLGDSAFAVACNSYNEAAVAAAAAIEFLSPVRLDDELTAEARVRSQGRRSGLYDVEISNQRGEPVALFRGRAHRLGRPLFDERRGSGGNPSSVSRAEGSPGTDRSAGGCGD